MIRTRLGMAAGRRQTYVTIEKASDADPNASFEVVPEYLTSFHRYCQQLLTSGREFQAAMQTVGLLHGILKLPYDEKTASITSRDRVRINDEVLNIAAPPVNEGGRNELITIWVVKPE